MNRLNLAAPLSLLLLAACASDQGAKSEPVALDAISGHSWCNLEKVGDRLSVMKRYDFVENTSTVARTYWSIDEDSVIRPYRSDEQQFWRRDDGKGYALGVSLLNSGEPAEVAAGREAREKQGYLLRSAKLGSVFAPRDTLILKDAFKSAEPQALFPCESYGSVFASKPDLTAPMTELNYLVGRESDRMERIYSALTPSLPFRELDAREVLSRKSAWCAVKSFKAGMQLLKTIVFRGDEYSVKQIYLFRENFGSSPDRALSERRRGTFRGAFFDGPPLTNLTNGPLAHRFKVIREGLGQELLFSVSNDQSPESPASLTAGSTFAPCNEYPGLGHDPKLAEQIRKNLVEQEKQLME